MRPRLGRYPSLLKEGGVWINFGPLLFHWADSSLRETDERYQREFTEVLHVSPTFGHRCLWCLLPASELIGIVGIRFVNSKMLSIFAVFVVLLACERVVQKWNVATSILRVGVQVQVERLFRCPCASRTGPASDECFMSP